MEKHESMLQSELCLQTCVYDELKSAGNCKENLCGALCGKHLSWACHSVEQGFAGPMAQRASYTGACMVSC